MIRINALSLIFFLWGVYFIYKEKGLHLFILSFVYTLFYFGSIILVVFALIYSFLGKTSHKFSYFKVPVFILAGIVLGLACHPHFPDNISFLYNYIYSRINFSNPTIQMNTEWKYFSFSGVVTWLLPYISFLFFISWSEGVRSIASNRRNLFFFISSIFLLILSFIYTRSFEYFIPISILFIAVNMSKIQKKAEIDAAAAFWLKSAIVFILICNQWMFYGMAIQETRSFQKAVEPSIAWLKEHAADRDLILNYPYSTFPKLFCELPSLRYVDGLEPDFLRRESPEIFDRIYSLIASDVPQFDLGSFFDEPLRYVYISKYPSYKFDRLISNFMKNANYSLRYRDSYVVIFECLEKNGSLS